MSSPGTAAQSRDPEAKSHGPSKSEIAGNTNSSATEESVATALAAPVNDACANATAISGMGEFSFNNTSATLDGPAHAACVGQFNQPNIDKDVWYCWTAPSCGATTLVSTCGDTTVDTKIAVYTGCNCPPTDANLISCNDDDCSTQSRVSFPSQAGQSYLIRIGSFPGLAGGTGLFNISCQASRPCTSPSQNCQTRGTSLAFNSNRLDFKVADNFTPLSSGQVSSICFWGAYVDDIGGENCFGSGTDAIVVKYYADNNGLPGNLLTTYSQSSATLAVNGPVATGDKIASRYDEYEFRATHAALGVSAGACYWVEITNEIPGCSWYWEGSLPHDERSVQDGFVPNQPKNGYDLNDLMGNDTAFCLSTALGDPNNCTPPPPGNDACASATPISGPGEYFFDNSSATTDGPGHAQCLSAGETGMDHDIWYCWTSTCSGEVLARTCDRTAVDTRLAVYDGCECPVTDASLLSCNDDLCDGYFTDQPPRASMVRFNAIAGHTYEIRVGTYPTSPGGTGTLSITCGPPANPSCPGTGSCCEGTGGLGCDDVSCCESVCACDPFCCSVGWDADCSGAGFVPGCGAQALCACNQCGGPTAGDCCSGHNSPFCLDAACCQAVCACDSFCCDTEWDQFCATTGADNNGCGAGELCGSLCRLNCPAGAVTWVNPPNGVVDAGRPFDPAIPSQILGINQIIATAPSDADPRCWTLCETDSVGSANGITNVLETSGTYTLMLARAISPGAVTTISYTNINNAATVGRFTSHPANVDGAGFAEVLDVSTLVAAMAGTATLPWGVFSSDIDRSTEFTPLDILGAIDLLNGAGTYTVWNGSIKPSSQPFCP